MTDLDALIARVRRAFGDRQPSLVERDYRAVVGPSSNGDANVQAALEALRNLRRPTPLQLAELELAIRIFRPAIASRRGALRLSDEHRQAFPAWNGFAEAVRPHLYAIGRIDRGPRAPASVPESAGTGFLVTRTVLVTNRHVVEVLSLGGMELERGMAVVNFRQEMDERDDEAPVAILSCLAIHPTFDLALLEIEAPAAVPGRSPLKLASAPAVVGAAVVVVGYPFADAERNPLFVDGLFESRYGVKRASPGEVIGMGREVVHHDASTLGGNSGSPLLEMSTARVLGIHARGGFAVRNTAVASTALAPFIDPHIKERGSP